MSRDPHQTFPNKSTYLILTHNLKCRDLAGLLVQLAQNTIVRGFRVDSLPGWTLLRNAQGGGYAPVRDEAVDHISVPWRPDGYHAAFPPTELADSTLLDIIEVDPVPMIVRDDVVVCDGHGEALWIASGTEVSIFAHNRTTFAWFKTAAGQTFVSDSHLSIRMNRIPATRSDDIEGTVAAGPVPQLSPLVDIPGYEEEVALQSTNIEQADVLSNPRQDSAQVPTHAVSIPRKLAVQLEATAAHQDPGVAVESPGPVNAALTTGADFHRGDGFGGGVDSQWDAFSQHPGLPALREADLEEEMLAGTLRASPADFTGTDTDFCPECFSFTVDHAAYCRRGQGRSRSRSRC